jgi:hypothetical protein
MPAVEIGEYVGVVGEPPLPTSAPAPAANPAPHICRVCEVAWRDDLWTASPCWSCGAMCPTSSGRSLVAPTVSGESRWLWPDPRVP